MADHAGAGTRLLVTAVVLVLVLSATATAERIRAPLVHEVHRAEGEIVIDGVIDEAAWTTALRRELHFEVDPGENVEPPVATEFFLTYDDERVLVAFRCFDHDPAAIRARYWDRDGVWTDDWIGIMFDTFNDQRRAFEFVVNPLGVQMDAINDDVNNDYDRSWDAIWESRGRVTDQGYEVEVAIPFSQLRFQATDGPQTWGIDVFRSYPRENRHHIGLFPRQRGANSYLGQADKIVGFAGVEPGRNVELAPTATWGRVDERGEMPNGPLEEVDSDAEVGLTAKWGVTPNTTLSMALNPDFSQVEADTVQLDINQQFSLYFSETRPFFLEGADFFNSDIDLVHTRTIVDPSAALKVTGKSGAHTFGLFTARDDLTHVMIPGSQGSSSDIFELDSTSTVGRYRYDFGGSSTVGVVFTDRRGGGYTNSVAAIDAVYRWSEADTLSINIAGSSTEYNRLMVDEFDLDETDVDDGALSINYHHGERNWYVRAAYEDFGGGFRADAGWLPRVDFRMLNVGGNYIWWGEGRSLVNVWEVGGDVDKTEEQNGNLIEEEAEAWFHVRGRYQSHVGVGCGTRNRIYEGVEYEQDFAWANASARPNGAIGFGLAVSGGDWIDFEHNRAAENFAIAPWIDLNLGQHVHLRLNHRKAKLDVDDGELFRTGVTRLRAVYQFDTRLFVRAVLQWVDVEHNQSLYADFVEPREKDLYTQLLVSYTINPQSVLYVGYSDRSNETDDWQLTRSNRTFFVKLGYAWLF